MMFGRRTGPCGAYSRMAILHAISGQTVDVRPLGSELPSTQSVAFFKTAELELMRLVLVAGKSLPPHKFAGEITIQCLEGKIDVSFEGCSHVLGAGQLLYLSGGVEHSVLGLEDATALLTIVLRKQLAGNSLQGT